MENEETRSEFDGEQSTLSTYAAALDRPLWVLIALLVVAIALGLVAYIPSWHGSRGTMLRLAFWSSSILVVMLLPFVPRSEHP